MTYLHKTKIKIKNHNNNFFNKYQGHEIFHSSSPLLLQVQFKIFNLDYLVHIFSLKKAKLYFFY